LCARCNKGPMHCNKCVEMSKHAMVLKERAKEKKWSNYKSLIKEEKLRNHETYAKESLEKKGSSKPLVLILLPPTHLCLNYIWFFLLSREKVWIWEPSFFLFRFELLIVRFKSFLTYFVHSYFLLSPPTLVTLWNKVIMLLGFYKKKLH
jgi:hypothetical protein